MTDLTLVRGGAIALSLAALRRLDDFDAAAESMADARGELEDATARGVTGRELLGFVRKLDEARAAAAAALVASHRAEAIASAMTDYAAMAMGGAIDAASLAVVANQIRALLGPALVVAALDKVAA